MTKLTATPLNDKAVSASRLPLRGWALELARRWNGGSYSLFVLHGNIFDLFPLPDGDGVGYVPLKTYLLRRLFPGRACVLFYDISGGLTFGSPEMQKRFYDEKADSEATWANYSITGKLMSFHNALEDLHNPTPDKPPSDAKAMEKLYSSISQDTYGFYSEVIARIQEGRIGKQSWTAGNTQNDHSDAR